MNFIEKIIETIKNPKNAMKSIAEEPMIEEAVMIAGISAILAALMVYIQSYKVIYVFEGIDNAPSSMQTSMATIGVVFAFIFSFILWLVVAGALHLISMALGGEGKFYPQMVTIVGYTSIPLLLAGLIGIIILSMAEPMTITISPANPMAAKELYKSSWYNASIMISIIMQAWSSIILFFGVQSAHKLTTTKSAIIALIPLAFLIISTLLTIGSLSLL